jgi:hypothetical protein
MASRFRFEPQTTLQKLAARIRYPTRWREKTTPWVSDLQGGTRFQLACDEAALIERLNVPTPAKSEWPASPVTLDEVANAAYLRRIGYVFDWSRIASLESSGTRRRLGGNKHGARRS